MEAALNLGMAQDFRHRDAADADHQGADLGAGQGAGRRGAGRPDRGGQPHLLPRRARDAAPLGLRLRDLPGLRAARQRLGGLGRGEGAPALGHDLCRQGDLPDPAGRGRPGGPGGGVLPLRRLQPVVRARDRTAPRRSAPSATPISWAWTAWAAAGSPTPSALADAVAAAWTGGGEDRLVVCTGGEPLLQLDDALIEALHARGFQIAVETNGTLAAPRGHRLDLRQPQGRRAAGPDLGPGAEAGLSAGGRRSGAVRGPGFRALLLQPMDGPAAGGEHRGRHRLLPCPPALAFKRADAQVPRHRLRRRDCPRPMTTRFSRSPRPPPSTRRTTCPAARRTAPTRACTATRSGWRRPCAARRPAAGRLGRRPRRARRGAARPRRPSWTTAMLNEKPGLESPTLEHSACGSRAAEAGVSQASRASWSDGPPWVNGARWRSELPPAGLEPTETADKKKAAREGGLSLVQAA